MEEALNLSSDRLLDDDDDDDDDDNDDDIVSKVRYNSDAM